MEEVWEEKDGLDPEDFNPKTFFKLHGTAISIFNLKGALFEAFLHISGRFFKVM